MIICDLGIYADFADGICMAWSSFSVQSHIAWATIT